MDRCVCAAGPVYQAASTGPGDEETEAALEHELREEHEGYWYEGLFTPHGITSHHRRIHWTVWT